MSTQPFSKEILKHYRGQLSEAVFEMDQTEKSSVLDMYGVLAPVLQPVPVSPLAQESLRPVSAEVITQAQQATDAEAQRLAQIRDDIERINGVAA